MLDALKRTRVAVIGTGILSEPLITVYSLLAFVLHKELDATPFQIAVLTMLVPVVSIFSLYWSASIAKRRDRLLTNVILAGILSRIPFLFFPIIDDPWIVIACAGFYMMMVRGGVPAWMEILKLNLPKAERTKIFAWGSTIGFVEGILLAIPVGLLLDYDSGAWRWVFPAFSLMGIVGVCLQAQVPICLDKLPMPYQPEGSSLLQKLLDPWKNTFNLLKERPDFCRFQWGFMLCGFGIMITRPALPYYFNDVLQLSYTDLTIAFSLCKGMGYALTSTKMAKLMNRLNIFTFTSLPCFAVALHFLLLLLAPLHPSALYLAYVFYGVMLAGNHLSWNLSGPHFSRHEESLAFSSVNVVTVGLRGMVGPPLGSFITLFFGPMAILVLGMGFCGAAGLKLFQWGRKQELTVLES